MPATTKEEGKRRCSAPDHQGPRLLPADKFADDRAQPSGKRSHCKTCYNAKQKKNRQDPAKREDDRLRSKALHQRATAAADERDEEALEKLAAEARRIQAEKERRLADDHAPLKPDDFGSESDDFDTSVANRPDMTKAERRAASKEKRQEYSAAMGKHAHYVRGAAIAASKGGDIVDAMPEDAGGYIGALAEQERRFGNRRLARSVSVFSAGEELARQLWMRACRQYLTGRVVPTGYAAKGPTSRKMKRSVCLLLSDLHLGAELLAADNPQPFRKVEEARRLEYIMRQAIDYKPQYRKDSELVLMIIGDVIEGLLLHDMRDGSPLTEQKVIFQRYGERMIAEFARAFPRVRVFFQPGNHGRDKLRHPGRATSAKWDGHEWQMYYALMQACQHLKNVTWDLPFRAIGKVDLHGSILGITHGDTEVKLGDPDTKSKENSQTLADINNTQLWGCTFDAWAFGHFHKPRYQPKKLRMIFNGALVPPNGHARASGYINESCGQYLWEAVEGYPIGDVRFIEVGRDQDTDNRLGTIIKPFRFDLE